ARRQGGAGRGPSGAATRAHDHTGVAVGGYPPGQRRGAGRGAGGRIASFRLGRAGRLAPSRRGDPAHGSARPARAGGPPAALRLGRIAAPDPGRDRPPARPHPGAGAPDREGGPLQAPPTGRRDGRSRPAGWLRQPAGRPAQTNRLRLVSRRAMTDSTTTNTMSTRAAPHARSTATLNAEVACW